MNPRAQAANDFTRGIKNDKASFNNIQPRTPWDKKSQFIGYLFLAVVTFIFGYFTFFSDSTSVLKNAEMIQLIWHSVVIFRPRSAKYE